MPPARHDRPPTDAPAMRVLSIRGKILMAFLVMSALTGALGFYAIESLTQSGRLVAQTYDRPLMAIGYARAALADFSRMEAGLARRFLAREPGDRAALERIAADYAADLESDLDVVEKRSTSERARKAVAKVRAAVAAWKSQRNAVIAGTPRLPDWVKLDRSARVVNEQLDLLINYAAGDGFLRRQEAMGAITTNTRVQLAGTIAALLLSIIVTGLLVRRIVGPVGAASRAANRIAQGELDVAIPITGRDELASLMGAMTIMRDNIRAMVEKEVALRRSAQLRLIDAIETTSEGVIVVDGAGKIVVANSEVERCFAPVSHVMSLGGDFQTGAQAAVAAGVFAATTEAERKTMIEALDASDLKSSIEVQFADGRWRRISRNRTSEGGFVAIFSDITLQKEREAVLREAAERAEAANRSKTEFLSNMSHELRTPLNAVIGFSELMASETMGPLGQPQYKDFMGDILTSARSLLQIINDILDWAKLDGDSLEFRFEPVGIAETFEDCGHAMRAKFEAGRVAFDVTAPPLALYARADRAKLRQILLNLLSNAAKFTPAGGTTTMSARARGDGALEIKVADTGIGMQAEDIPVALAPFGQVDGRLSRKYEGTGLGLSLSKALAERQGGTLTIASEPGKGTTVTVTLPCADPAAVSRVA